MVSLLLSWTSFASHHHFVKSRDGIFIDETICLNLLFQKVTQIIYILTETWTQYFLLVFNQVYIYLTRPAKQEVMLYSLCSPILKEENEKA